MQLPEGWHISSLNSILRKTETIDPTKNPEKEFNYIDVSSVSNTFFKITETQKIIGKDAPSRARRLVKKNDVIFATIRPTLKRIAIISDEFDNYICSTGYIVLRPQTHVDSNFLFYWLLNKPFQDQMQALQKGASYPAVTDTEVRNQLILIPSLPEQKRIVAILDEAFAGINQAIANTEKNLANARELFDRVLTKKLDEFANLPATQKLTDLTELIIDCEHKTAPTQLTGYPSIRTPNIGKGDLLIDGVYRVSQETYKTWTKRAIPQANDLILAREAPAGNIAVIPEGQKVCLGQRTVLIRPKLDKVQSYFLAYLILHPTLQQRLLSSSTGATVQHVNVKDIRNLGIGKLPNLSTQSILISDIKIAKVESGSLENIYQQKLQSLTELKQSLLQKAFTGELTANNVDKLVNP